MLIRLMIIDNNWKIRLDGAKFLKMYLPYAKESPRFDTIYFPELVELLNDEENYVRIEAIEACTEVIDRITEEDIEKEFIPVVLNIIECHAEDIITRLASLIGKIVYELRRQDIYIKFKAEFLDFFRVLVQSKEYELRLSAAYNLPCFFTMLRQYEEEGCFHDYYLQFLAEDIIELRILIASHIHIAFQNSTQEEDMNKLRDAFRSLLNNNERDVIFALAENMDITLKYYLNEQAINN